MMNAFADDAKGIKMPDDDSANSVAVQLRDTFTMTTDANGFAAASVQPNLSAVFREAITMPGGVPTGYGIDVGMSNLGSIQVSLDQIRIVSWAARIYSTLPPTEQGGALRVLRSSERATAGAALTGGLFDSVDTFPVSGADIVFLSKPKGTTFKEYKSTTTTHEYGACNFYVYGAEPAKVSAFTVEVVFNIEGTVKLGTTVAALSTPGKEHDMVAMSAASRAHSRHSGVHAHGPSFYSKMGNLAKTALYDVASSFLPGVAGKVASWLNPSRRGRTYPMIQNVD